MTSNGSSLPSAQSYRDFHELSPLTKPPVIAGTPVRLSRDNASNSSISSVQDTALERVEDTDKKTYGIVRKIFEGLGLILLNAVTLGSINLELLRGDNSFLKNEYERVFFGKKITVIASKEESASPLPKSQSTGTSPSKSVKSDDSLVNDHPAEKDQALVPVVPPNPYIGRSFPLTLPIADPTKPERNLNVTFSVLEMNLEIFGLKPEDVLNSPPLRPDPAKIEDLSERRVVPTHNSGYLSSVSSALSQGWNTVVSEEAPRLKADATILVVVDRVQHLIKITLDTPLSGDQSPIDMVMANLHNQLPSQLRGAEKHQLQLLGGSSHLQGDAQLQLVDEPEDGLQLIRTAPVLHLEDNQKGLVGSAPIAALVASTALFEQAFSEELRRMAHTSQPAPTVNPVNLYRSTPGIGLIGWLARATGTSSRLGFNPRTMGVAGAAIFMAGLMLSRRNHSYQRRSVAQDHAVTRVNPAQENRSFLGWIYDVIRNMATSAVSTLMPQRTIQPIASTIFQTGNTSLAFDYMGRQGPGLPLNSSLFARYGITPVNVRVEE